LKLTGLYRYLLIASLVALSTNSHAQTQPCLNDLPESIRSTIEQDNWTILQLQDLAAEDIPVWKVNHPGQCPGVTAGNFYPKAKTSYLVAMIQRDEKKLTEKLLLVYLKKDKTETHVVVPPTQVPDPSVVWKLHPGHYLGIDGKASISRESFVFEKLVGPARQYYYQGTTLKSIVLSR
jgi:hypothetical protein